MRVLVLDLATVTGFCFGTEAGPVQHGAFRLPSTGDDIASFLKAYRSWLTVMIARHQPEEVVFEMPVLPATGNLKTLRKLYSLAGATELFAVDMGCTVSEANLMNIRKHFIGCAFAPKHVPKPERRKWLKNKTIDECRSRGLEPSGEDAADALALFSYVLTMRVPGFVMGTSQIAAAA